jgi:hypothetical protein
MCFNNSQQLEVHSMHGDYSMSVDCCPVGGYTSVCLQLLAVAVRMRYMFFVRSIWPRQS